jgi:hypothetical protein
MAPSHPLIISRLTGGLGNQLFQYAAGRSLARAASAELAVDLSIYSSPFERRAYGLQRFNLDVITLVGSRFDARDETVGFPEQARLMRRPPVPVVTETDYDFDSTLLGRRGSLYLFGFWQSWRYFSDIADDLRRELSLGLTPQAQASLHAAISQRHEPVAVHVRRGDYLDPRFQIAFGSCEAEYYRAAMDILRARTKSPTFFLFSDDPDWCGEHLADADCEVVSRSAGDPVDDLMLMARCRHHILANSSFGWWGAWFGAQPDSIIVAPMPWFTEAPHVQDLVPPHWIRLNRETGGGWKPIDGSSPTALASVVLRATGDPEKLRRAIETVRTQDYPNTELIVVLKPGLRALGELARSILGASDRAVIVDAGGQTPNAARNAGVKASKGKWIAFLDDSDSWVAETLRIQIETAELSDADVVICRTVPISDGTRPAPALFPPSGSPHISLRKPLEDGGVMGCASNTIVRLDALREIGGLDESEALEASLGLYARMRSPDKIVLHWSRLVESPRPYFVPHA